MFPNRFLQTALWGLALLLIVHFVSFSIDAARRTSHGYVTLYTSARLVREGASVSQFYDDVWFSAQTTRYDSVYRDIFKPNTPIAALILLPLSDLDYAGARVLWIAFNVALFAAAVYRLLRELNLRGVWFPGMIVLILLYDPLYANLELGQTYMLMFVLLVIAWVGYRRGDSRALGIALGLMLALKTAGVFLWVLLILQRRWSALAWGIVTALILALLSLPFVGVEAWLTYIDTLGDFNGQAWLSVSAFQTPTSLFHHLFTYDAQWNPAPIVHAPIIASILSWGSIAAIASITVFVGAQHVAPKTRNDILFAACAIVSLLIVPLALDYHYTTLLLPVIILAVQKWRSRWMQALLILAVVLIGADIAYRQPELTSGWRALLAYPKLYGAVLLWGLAVITPTRGLVSMSARV